MAETVNPTQSSPAPTPTPSQPAQIPRVSSPAPQSTTNSNLPPQQIQPPPSHSPAPTLPPPFQPQPPMQNHVLPNPPSTTSSAYPARAPPGAPGRNYLNTHLAPYLRNGMTNILDAKPGYPLRWLGEYLISQSLIHEGGTDEKGVMEHFIYEEHGAAVKRLRPESTTAAVGQGPDQAMADGGVNGVEPGKDGAREEAKGVGDEDTQMEGS